MPPYLPEEIWLQIFSYLKYTLPVIPGTLQHAQHDEFENQDGVVPSALSSVCQVCKDFRRIAQSMLYECVATFTPRANSSLARTLSERPDLAQIVHTLDLSITCEGSPCWEAMETLPPGQAHLNPNIVIGDLDVSNALDLSLCLALTPGLKTLQLVIPCKIVTTVPPLIVR